MITALEFDGDVWWIINRMSGDTKDRGYILSGPYLTLQEAYDVYDKIKARENYK